MEFPFLGVDQDQATMIMLSFAQQTELFFKTASGDGGIWRDFALAAGLIGFVQFLILVTARKLDGLQAFAWLILLFLVLSPPFVSNVFFHLGKPSELDTINSPYALVQGAEPIPNGRTPADDIRALNFDPASEVAMFTPQVLAIHYLNQIRGELAKEFEGAADAGLQNRLASVEAMRRTKVEDYRPHFDMAMFQQVCGPKVPELRENAWLLPSQLSRLPNGSQITTRMSSATFTMQDLIRAHQLYWDEVDRAESILPGNGPGAECAPGTSGIGSCIKTTGLPPLGNLIAEGGGMTEAEIAQEFAVATRTILGNDDDFSHRDFIEEFLASKDNFRMLLARLGNDANSAANTRFLKTPVNLVFANVDNQGRVQDDETFMGFNTKKTRNCYSLHERTIKSFDKALKDQLETNVELAALLDKYMPRGPDRTEANMPANARIRLAYEAAVQEVVRLNGCEGASVSHEGNGFGEIIVEASGSSEFCKGNLQQVQSDVARLNTLMLTSAMRNADPEASAILGRAGDPSFFSPFRNLAKEFGEQAAPVAVFFKALFGGFAAGTYAGIMPMVISLAIAMMITATPLLYIIGLGMPTWSMGILFMPVLGVVYFKMVEISFTLIKGIFGFYIKSAQKGVVDLPESFINMADIVLGIGYTAAFAIAAFLMFGLRNPQSAIQQVVGAADKTSQISFKEATAMVGGAMGVAKIGASFLPGGAAINALGKAAGTLESMGSGKGGYGDTFNAARSAVFQEDEKRATASIMGQMTPQESRSSLQARVTADVDETMDKRTLQAAKGFGVDSAARKSSTYQEPVYQNQSGRYVTKQVVKDEPVIAMGDMIHKHTGTPKYDGHDAALDMFKKRSDGGSVARVVHDHQGKPVIEINAADLKQYLPQYQGLVQQLEAAGKAVQIQDMKTREVKYEIEV